MRRRALVTSLLAGLLMKTPVMAQDSSPEASGNLKSGQIVKGPIALTNQIAVAYYYLGNDDGDTRIIGELENVSETDASAFSFQVQGIDEDGYAYGDDSYIFPEPIVLAPGERLVFQGSVGENLPPESFASIAFTVGSYLPTYTRPTLEITGIPARGKTADVAGKRGAILNTGNQVVDARILISWFAPDGTALGTCFGNTQGSIPPGKELPLDGIDKLGGCGNIYTASDILGIDDSEDTGYALQLYMAP